MAYFIEPFLWSVSDNKDHANCDKMEKAEMVKIMLDGNILPYCLRCSY